MSQLLSAEEIAQRLEALPGWELVEGKKIKKTYECQDFKAAVAFIVELSFICEQLDHHPELSNVWNKVTLEVTTHDSGNRLTEKDFALAEGIEARHKPVA